MSALNTHEMVPANLNLFFLDLSAMAAVPNGSAAAFSCESYLVESHLLVAH